MTQQWRRGVRAVVAGVATLAVTACAAGSVEPRAARVVVAEVLAAAPDAVPTAASDTSAAVASAARGVMVGGTAVPTGWALVPLSDVDDGFALVETTRPTSGAGIVAFRGRNTVAVVVAVPLPDAERGTEALGVDLFVKSRASALVVAGSPTSASDPGGVFKAVTTDLATAGLVTVVAEGYSSDAAAGLPEVVLRGTGDYPTDDELRLGVALQQYEVDVCVIVGSTCEAPDTLTQDSEPGSTPSGDRLVRVQLAGALATNQARRQEVVGFVGQAFAGLD